MKLSYADKVRFAEGLENIVSNLHDTLGSLVRREMLGAAAALRDRPEADDGQARDVASANFGWQAALAQRAQPLTGPSEMPTREMAEAIPFVTLRPYNNAPMTEMVHRSDALALFAPKETTDFEKRHWCEKHECVQPCLICEPATTGTDNALADRVQSLLIDCALDSDSEEAQVIRDAVAALRAKPALADRFAEVMCFWAVGEGDTCPNKATHFESDEGLLRPTCDSCRGAALARQAQPLTDAMIVELAVQCTKSYPAPTFDEMVKALTAFGHVIRDPMAQQAQVGEAPCTCWRNELCPVHPSQPSQPEMPTCDEQCDKHNGNHSDACEVRYNAQNP